MAQGRNVSALDDVQLFTAIAANPRRREAYFTTLFDRYAKAFLGFLRASGHSQEESEDIIQILFERLITKADTLGGIDNPRGYLWQMVRNLHVDAIRQLHRRREDSKDEFAMESLCQVKGGYEHSVYMECFCSAWVHFKREFPDRANVIEMAALGGLGSKDLAAALDRSYGAAREYLSQCRRRLKELVNNLCGEEPA